MQKHEHWGTKIGFLLASAGSAIGLGSLWRFPYVVGENGGGAFVLMYIAFSILIALPAFIGELIVGRNAQKSSVLAYEALGSSNWRIVGWLSFLTSFLILSYYNVVSGWCINYAIMSLSHFANGKTPDEIRGIFTLLTQSGDMSIFWLIVFIMMNVGIVYSGVQKGIEKWSKVLMPALFVLLLIMLSFSVALPGFGKAFTFIFSPDFSKVTGTTVLMALGMSFFTMSIGLGINVTYGSYLSKKESIPQLGILVTIMTTMVSLLAALMIFPIIFTYDMSPEGGPGLIFKTMPILFEQMPATVLLSTIFFILVSFAALTSTIAMFEVLVANLMEVVDLPRAKAIVYIAAGLLLMGIPSALSNSDLLFTNWVKIYGQTFFDTLSNITANWMMPIAGLLSTVFAGWIMKREKLVEGYLHGDTLEATVPLFTTLLQWIIPAAVIIVILQELGLY